MISVIGSGKWGSAIAKAIAKNHDVQICPFSKKDGNYIDIDEAKKSKYLIFSLSVAGVKDYLLKNFTQDPSLNPQKILIASKGIVKDEFLHDIFAKFLKKKIYVC